MLDITAATKLLQNRLDLSGLGSVLLVAAMAGCSSSSLPGASGDSEPNLKELPCVDIVTNPSALFSSMVS